MSCQVHSHLRLIRLYHKQMPMPSVNPISSQIYEIHTHKNKTYMHKHQTQIFEELVPSVLPLIKKNILKSHELTSTDFLFNFTDLWFGAVEEMVELRDVAHIQRCLQHEERQDWHVHVIA